MNNDKKVLFDIYQAITAVNKYILTEGLGLSEADIEKSIALIMFIYAPIVLNFQASDFHEFLDNEEQFESFKKHFDFHQEMALEAKAAGVYE